MQDPFPPGDFLVRVGLRYVSVARCGDGFGALDNFWEDYYGTACRPFLLWQDGGGWYSYTGSSGYYYIGRGPNTEYHIYEWTYVNGRYTFFLDGTMLSSGDCAPRPTHLFFGHPHPIGCSPWTSFEIDFVHIEPIGVELADLALAKSGPATVNPAQNLTYTLVVTNSGPSDAASVVIQDTLPAGATFVSADNGGTESGGIVTWPAIASLANGANVSYTVTVTAPATGTLLNVARADAGTADPDTSNNNGTAPANRVTTVVNELADLALAKSGPASVSALGLIAYTITTTNHGPSAASSVVVRDLLAAGVTFVSASDGGTESGGIVTWPPVTSLGNGASFNYTVTVTAPACGTLVNIARAAASTFDPDASNNDGWAAANRVTTTVIDQTAMTMVFDFTPSTLNLQSQGLWVTGFLEPDSPLAASDVDISSIRLNGTVPVDPVAPTALGDRDGDGVTDLMVKFNRAAVELTLSEGDSVPVNVTGTVNGHAFSGTDHIRVRRAVVAAPLAGSHLAAGSVSQVRWEMPSGVTVESVALLQAFDGGSTWSLIARGQPNTGSYDWTVPNVQTDQAKVAVVLVESADETGYLVDGVLGVSEAFSIEGTVSVGNRGPAELALAIRGPTPNPAADGRLWVEFALRDGSAARLELLDVAGRVLISRQVETLGPGTHALDLSNGGALRPGIYFLRLTQGGREVRVRAAVIK